MATTSPACEALIVERCGNTLEYVEAATEAWVISYANNMNAIEIEVETDPISGDIWTIWLDTQTECTVHPPYWDDIVEGEEISYAA